MRKSLFRIILCFMILTGIITSSINVSASQEDTTSPILDITIYKSKMELSLDDKPKAITRGEFSKLLVESLGMDASNAESNFSDVPRNHPFYREISIISNLGIMRGFSIGSFKPENNITRADYAVVFTRALGYKLSNKTLIRDVTESHWAYNSITTMVDAGLMKLDQNGHFRPYDVVVLEPKGKLIPIVTPPNASDKRVTWSSSNPEIAEVDEVGQVTPKSVGTAIITATSVDGGSQATSEVTVIASQLDTLEPSIINDVYDNSSEVTGIAAAGLTVEIKAGEEILGTTTTNLNGYFTVDIPNQPAGTSLEVLVRDENGKENSTIVIIESSFTLKTPNVNWVKDSDAKITGSFDRDSTIVVKARGEVIGTGQVDETGHFSINIEPQNEGTVLSVSARNIDGYESKISKVTVQKSIDLPLVQDMEIHKQDIELSLDDEPKAITRGEFSKLLVESLGMDATNAESKFSDVSNNHPYYREISLLSNLGIMNGYSVGSFKPENIITRADYAVVFTRALGYKPSNRTLIRDITASDWAYNSITTMVDAGLMKLDENGNFRPHDVVVLEPKGKLIPTVTPPDASDKRVTWSSSNPQIAEVDEVGQVTPKSVGTAIITATSVDGEGQATSKVKVIGTLEPPIVNDVYDTSSEVAGKAAAGSKVIVRVGENVLGTGNATREGKYLITIPKQQAGTKLTVIATDDTGNMSETAELIVLDKTAPNTKLVLNSDVLIGNNDFYTMDVPVILKANDNFSEIAKIEYRINSGEWKEYTSEFIVSEGIYTIDYRSVDKAHNVEKVKSTTIKVDKTAPTLDLKLDKTFLESRNHKMIPINAVVDAKDATSGIASVVLTSINSNEKLKSDDIQNSNYNIPITGSTDSFELRAARFGNGNGRIYTITYTATDKAGNVITKNVNVTVPHDQSNK